MITNHRYDPDPFGDKTPTQLLRRLRDERGWWEASADGKLLMEGMALVAEQIRLLVTALDRIPAAPPVKIEAKMPPLPEPKVVVLPPDPPKTPEISPEPDPYFFPLDLPGWEKMTIEEMELSVRAYRCLERAQIRTVKELTGQSRKQLLRRTKYMGTKTLNEIDRELIRLSGKTLLP